MNHFAWILIGFGIGCTFGALTRNTVRAAAFSDAADFLRAIVAREKPAHSDPRLALTRAARFLELWATEPQGGRERMPLYGFKGSARYVMAQQDAIRESASSPREDGGGRG